MNWVLLRGLGRESRHWFDFPEALATAFAPAKGRIVALDLPGFGTEKSAKAPATVAANTEYLREKFLALRGSDRDWGLLGISLGGMVALDWAHRYSDDFNHLVVVNSSAKDLSGIHHRLSVYAMYRILRAGFTRDIEVKERQLLKMVSNLRAHDEAIRQGMVEIAKTSGITTAKLARQLTAASRFQCPSQVLIPTLILASLKDAMVDVRCSKGLAEKLTAQIKFHPAAGHDLTLDDPKWCAEQVHAFIYKAENPEAST